MNNVFPRFMEDIFRLIQIKFPGMEEFKSNLDIPMAHQVKFGTKNLRGAALKTI